MSRKGRKDFSVTDFDFRMDLDIEKDKMSVPDSNEEDQITEKGNTLDYYRDEMSQQEVAKLFDRNTKDKPQTNTRDDYYDEDEQYDEYDNDRDEGHIDYEYILNLLKESHKEEEYDNTVHYAKDGFDSTYEKSGYRVRESTRSKKTYGIVQGLLTLVFVVFFSAFGILAYRVNILSGQLEEANLHIEELKEIETRYNILTAEMEMLDTNDHVDMPELYEPVEPAESEIVENVEATEPNTPQTNTPQTYTVNRGESLWRISQRIYGDGNLYEEIMRANNISSPEDIHPGMVLIIPEVSQ